MLLVVTLIGEHGGIRRSSSDHEMLLLVLLILEIRLDCLISELLLSVRLSAQVRAPCHQTESHNQVEKSDISDEPPVKDGGLGAALVLRAAPDLHLDEKHARADEKVECGEQLGNGLQTVRHFHDLEKQEHEEKTPEDEDHARRHS